MININNHNLILNATRQVFTFTEKFNSFAGFKDAAAIYLIYTLNLENVLNDTDKLTNQVRVQQVFPDPTQPPRSLSLLDFYADVQTITSQQIRV